MSAERAAPASPASDPRSPAARWTTFGLEIDGPPPLDLPIAADSTSGRGRPTLLQVVGAEELGRRWGEATGEVEVLREDRYPDGSLFLRVEGGPVAGYRIQAPGFGDHLLNAGGTRISSVFPPEAGWGPLRLLFAQVLPLAALLQGYELLHASAVAMQGGVYGFVASSGTGKSSVAAHLVSSGAEFVTDDVMVLDEVEGHLLVHPGPAFMGLHDEELRRLPSRAPFGEVLARTPKPLLGTRPIVGATQLQGLFFLQRVRDEGPLKIVGGPTDPRILLGSAFFRHLNTLDRLRRYLEVCARVMATVPMAVVRIPPDVTARQVASAVREHVLGS